MAYETRFISPRIAERFKDAAVEFLMTTHDSPAANMILHYLSTAESDKRYATGSRNHCVEQLAIDVEAALGSTANMLFRAPGPLHDSLQTLMDSYEDAMDGIYYLTD